MNNWIKVDIECVECGKTSKTTRLTNVFGVDICEKCLTIKCFGCEKCGELITPIKYDTNNGYCDKCIDLQKENKYE